MAIRARLVAPPVKPPEVWEYHTLRSTSISASTLFSGERRMEADAYLSTGFGIRAAIESNAQGWIRFSELANVTQPSRLKGIVVAPEHGTPFLSATQVFDVRPVARKFLALERTKDARARFVEEGTILFTCSGSVGRSTLAHRPHHGVLISHDLLRVSPKAERDFGWVYAYLHSPQMRAMTAGAQYGHIIKHLETFHLEALPIPLISDDRADDFNRRVRRILDLRNEGYDLTREAEARFERALGSLNVADRGEGGFVVTASSALLSRRRRLDASAYNPAVSEICRHLAENGRGFTTIVDAGYDVWLPNRFLRVPAPDGVWLTDSAALTEINPDLTKRIADGDFGDAYRGRVDAGWLLMARSGQTYGVIGTTVLAGEDLEGHVVSDDVIRIKPTDAATMRTGYLVTALSHPVFGRPVVKSVAYGSSIPHLDVSDVAALQVVRLGPGEESAIADLAEGAAKARVEADSIERDIGADAGAIVDLFISSHPMPEVRERTRRMKGTKPR